MRTNAISHAIPMPKVYDILPPTKQECEELLACMYISPFAPKDSEHKRTPFVIRRNKIKAALEFDRTVAANIGWKSFLSSAGNRKRMRIIIAIAFFSQWSGNNLM